MSNLFQNVNANLSSRNRKFVVLSSMVLCLHITQAFIQEYIFQLENIRQYSSVFTFTQFIFYILFAYVHQRFAKRHNCLIPNRKWAIVGFMSTGTMALSNAAVAHLNYPTHLMFKSCKLIPVMIGSVFIVGKRYNPLNVLACVLMTIGIVFFTLGDCKIQPKFETIGIFLVCMALCFDAIVGNYQEKLFKQYIFLSNQEMIYHSYIFGLGYLVLFELIRSRTIGSKSIEGVRFFNNNIFATYILTGFYSITGYLGVLVILSLIKEFGALLAVTVTTMRKAVTIVLSFMLFPKAFSVQYVWSGMLVMMGIWLDVGEKHCGIYRKLMMNKKRGMQLLSV